MEQVKKPSKRTLKRRTKRARVRSGALISKDPEDVNRRNKILDDTRKSWDPVRADSPFTMSVLREEDDSEIVDIVVQKVLDDIDVDKFSCLVTESVSPLKIDREVQRKRTYSEVASKQ